MPRTSMDLPDPIHKYLKSRKDEYGSKVPFAETVIKAIQLLMKKDKK